MGCSGGGRFVETRKKPLSRPSQRTGDNTFMVFFRVFFPKKVKLLLQFAWMLCFPHKKYHDGNREPLGFATGRFLFFTNSTKWRTYGQKYGTRRSFCSSLYAIINCVWDFRIDHGKCFISSMRAVFFLGLFAQTILRQKFIILSQMTDFGRFWPVFEFFFLDALWRNFYVLNLVLKYVSYVVLSRAQHEFVLSSRSRMWLYSL